MGCGASLGEVVSTARPVADEPVVAGPWLTATQTDVLLAWLSPKGDAMMTIQRRVVSCPR